MPNDFSGADVEFNPTDGEQGKFITVDDFHRHFRAERRRPRNAVASTSAPGTTDSERMKQYQMMGGACSMPASGHFASSGCVVLRTIF